MKNIIVILTFIFISQLCPAQSNYIDMSAMEYVWNIINKLEKNIQPSEKDWEDMFACGGYKALGNWNNDNIRKNFELVFTASRKEDLKAALLTTNYWWKRDLTHLIKVKEQQQVLKKYQTEVDVDKILAEAIKRAEVYLVKGIPKNNPPPPIDFVIFSPDARSMGGSIIFDLKFTMDEGKEEFTKTLAHELHHHYSNFMKKIFNYPGENSSFDPIVSTLNQLKTEGIADLIDKPVKPVIKNNDTSGYLRWTNAQQQQTPKMKTLDSMLCKMSDDTTGMYDMGYTAFKMFPGNCHPNGQYMAALIKKHFSANSIIKCVNNPFFFIRLYRKACQNENTEYVLSDKAIEFIIKMESMFAVRTNK